VCVSVSLCLCLSVVCLFLVSVWVSQYVCQSPVNHDRSCLELFKLCWFISDLKKLGDKCTRFDQTGDLDVL